MKCPNCGTELGPLTTFLAGTQVGTQCPACWTRLTQRPVDPAIAQNEREAATSCIEMRRAA